MKETQTVTILSPLPKAIARYRIERFLGKGGFGVVYLAHDDQLQRLVAIKVPHHDLVGRTEEAEAYLTEARTVASLDHRSIVPVHDVGGTEQFPYFVVSKYIDGTDLATRIQKSRLSLHEAVELVATVAEALHYAHMQGLVHRDIKPGNILLDKSGKPFVADFGLALREQDVSKGALYAGTPTYMSPEQACGDGHRLDGRSDIFSLGVVLYELLTGKRPFRGRNRNDLLHQVVSVEPVPPRELDGAIPWELERICLKAISKRASNRYSTAAELAEDLLRWQQEQKHQSVPGALDVATHELTQKRKSWLTRRKAVVLLSLGAVTCAAAIEIGRRQPWLRWPSQGLEVTTLSTMEIVAGEEREFEIHVLGARTPKNVRLEFSGIPSGVIFNRDEGPKPAAATESSPAAPDAEIWRVRVSADLNMPKAYYGLKRDITLLVADGTRSAARVIQFHIEPPLMSVPLDCDPALGAKRKRVAEEKANYWDRIVRKLPGNASPASAKSCEFVLVPYNSELKLPSFYILQNKVWNDLFTTFDEQFGKAKSEDETDDWPDAWCLQGAAKGASDMPARLYPLHPVMRVNFRQAQEFAKWLGGDLPTCRQWDTAAGLYLPDSAMRQGPFLGVWQEGADSTLDIAVRRDEKGTMLIDEADADLSPFGCRHMAGNGAEWTRDIGKAFNLAPLRGCQYTKSRPLFYRDLREKAEQTQWEAEDVTATSPYTGFRIVIELHHAPPE